MGNATALVPAFAPERASGAKPPISGRSWRLTSSSPGLDERLASGGTLSVAYSVRAEGTLKVSVDAFGAITLRLPADSAAARKPGGRRSSTGYVTSACEVAVRMPRLVLVPIGL